MADLNPSVTPTAPKTKVTQMKEYILSIIKDRVDAYSMRTRKPKYGMSSATAYRIKLALDLFTTLSPDEIEELRIANFKKSLSGELVPLEPYIRKFEQMRGEVQGKADVKTIASGKDQYAILIAAIKVKIEDFLLEQEKKINDDIISSRQHIQQKYSTMDRKAFEELYGEKQYRRTGGYGSPIDKNNYYISMSKFYESRLGILLRLSDTRLPEFILKAQKSYREKEYDKLDKLVYKLKTKYPNLQNFNMTNYRKGVDGIEFTLNANSPEGDVSIYTQTIYAGGYNIQRLHLRWLMNVSDALGHKVKITQG